MNKADIEFLFKTINSNLRNNLVHSVLNSIGSNIFIDFTETDKVNNEWTIWISNHAWRITKNDDFVVGSGDNRLLIKTGLFQLLNRKIRQIQFTSNLLDLEIEFDQGYRLNTFIHTMNENEWTITLPKSEPLRLSLSNYKEIRHIENISKEFSIARTHHNNLFNFDKFIIDHIFINEEDELELIGYNNDKIIINSSTWRIEYRQQYLIELLDGTNEFLNGILKNLKGKKIDQIFEMQSNNEALFIIGSDYVLRTFSCCRSLNQWNYNHNFISRIKLEEFIK